MKKSFLLITLLIVSLHSSAAQVRLDMIDFKGYGNDFYSIECLDYYSPWVFQVFLILNQEHGGMIGALLQSMWMGHQARVELSCTKQPLVLLSIMILRNRRHILSMPTEGT